QPRGRHPRRAGRRRNHRGASGCLAVTAAAVLEIVRPGLATTGEDGGRAGLCRFVVSPSGPMDPLAHRLANQLVGNDGGAAALEITGPGGELTFLHATRFAIAGADLDAALDGQSLSPPTVA